MIAIGNITDRTQIPIYYDGADTMKHTLRFNRDGKFRILMISDIQEAVEIDPRTVPGIRAMIAKTTPDLIISWSSTT